MKRYSRISKDLEKIGAIILRGANDFSDLDIYINKEDYKQLSSYLLKNQFSLIKIGYTDNKYYAKIIDDQRLLIDIHTDVNSFLFFFRTHLTADFVRNYLNNPKDHQLEIRTLRYLLNFRDKFKYRSFLQENKRAIIHNDWFLNVLSVNPFKKKLKFSHYPNFAKRKVFTLIQYVGLFETSYIYWRYILKFFHRFRRKNQISVVLGPDGVGKTTIINKLAEHYPVIKCLYLGKGRFYNHKIIKRIQSKYNNVIVNFGLKIIFSILLYFSAFQAYILKTIGFDVLIDRHPYYDSFLHEDNSFHKYFDIFIFRFLFPRFDNVVIIKSDPHLILRRKAERSLYEIQNFYSKAESLEDNERIIFVDNNSKIESAVNSLAMKTINKNKI